MPENPTIRTDPKVSVMVSVYNQIHTLPRALESVLAQDYPNLEIIVGDDYSTDGDVGKIAFSYDDPRIIYFRNGQNMGMIGNYRKLLYEYASGDLAIMLNADDYWIDPGFISEAVKIFSENEGIILVFGELKGYVETTREFYDVKVNMNLPPVIEGNYLFKNYHKGYSISNIASLYVRQSAIETGFFNIVGRSQDWSAFLRLMLEKKVGYINHPVAVYCLHSQNSSKKTDVASLFESENYIHEVYEFATRKRIFSQAELETWRYLMLKRHHAKWLVKLYFLDKTQLPNYRKMLQTRHPEVWRGIRSDAKYWGFQLIKHYPGLLSWVFRHIIGQESFIRDLMAHRAQL